MSEIGSEFWTIETVHSDLKFFVSGRTALEFIIRDILTERKINMVHMPSFCCHTMIEPFLRHGVKVEYYDVYHENGVLKAEIPEMSSDDIFFYINYFGYESQCMGNLEEIRKSRCVVIEDATHSWLLNENKKTNSCNDYRFTSYRKWTGFTGISSAEKMNGKFIIQQKHLEHETYDALRKEAQEGKQKYLQFYKGEKRHFLETYEKAERLLAENYTDYRPSYESLEAFICLDKEKIKQARRENAKVLMEEISGIEDITPVFAGLGENDVPLCVPILVDESIRDEFRKYLISQQIYCPVHWPLSELYDGVSDKAGELYKRELSLVCDQRYGVEDMKRFVKCIRSYFGVSTDD